MVCKAVIMGCMLTDTLGGVYGGVGTLRTRENSHLVAIWGRSFGPLGGDGALPGNFASRRVAAAVGPAWQLHERRPWSYPHRGLSECRSARAWSWGGMWMSVAAVGKRPQNAQIHAYQALVEADRASLRRLKNGVPCPENASRPSTTTWTHLPHPRPMHTA